MNGDKGKQFGFSLAEVVVTVGIFSFATLIVSGIFIRSISTQKRLGLSQRIQSDTRLIMNRLVDEIKTKSIDYSSYPAEIVNPTDTLYLKDDQGRSFIYRESDPDFALTVCINEVSTPCIEYSDDGGATWYPVTSNSIKVSNLDFYITPTQDPFSRTGGSYNSNAQPLVTIVSALQASVTPPSTGQNILFTQTTVSSREYER